jgi:TP901 family phage tail tape measure protein
MNIGTLTASIGGNIAPLKQALAAANNELNRFSDNVGKSGTEVASKLTKVGQGMSKVGGMMSIGLTLPLLGAAAAAGKMAMSWEEGMAKINTTAQLPKEGLKALSDQIYKLGAEAGADLSTVPEAYEKIISQTGDATLSTEIFAAALKGAKAGFTDVSVVSGALAQSLSAIGGGAASAQEVIDTLFAAKRVGAGEFSDFANYIPSLIASAKGVGVSWKEVAGSFAYMTGKGNDAASSTMLLQNAFNALGKSDIVKGLKDTGISVFDSTGKMRGLSDIFTEVGDKMNGMSDESKSKWLETVGLKDQQAKQAFMVLSSETDKLREAMDATANSSGELETALGMAANPAQNMAGVMTNLKGIAIGFGLIMLPAINSMISGLSSLLGWFVGLSDATKKWIIGIGAVVAAIGPLLLGIGSIMLLIPKLKTGFTGLKIAMNFLKTNPFILIATAAIALGILIMELWKNCETFRAVVKYVALSVSAFFQKAWIEIKMGAELMWLGIKTYFTAIPKLATAVWNIIKRVMKGEAIGDVVKDEFSKIFEGIKDEASGIKEKYNEELAAIKTPDYKEILAKEKAVSAAKETGEAVSAQLEESMVSTATGGAGTGSSGVGKAKPLETMTGKSVSSVSGGLQPTFALAKTADAYKIVAASIKDVDTQFKIAKNSAELFGQPFDESAVRADLLKQKIDALTQQGLPANKAAIEQLGAEYRDLSTEMANTAKMTVDIGAMMTDAMNSAFSSIGEGIGQMFAGTADAGDLFTNLLGVVADFTASLGKSLIAAGMGAIAFKKLLATPWLAVAAGVALVALSSFVKAKLSAGAEAGSGGGGEAPTAGKLTSVPAFASGGIVPGNSFSGDSVMSRLNSGEMVLNQGQQRNLFNALDSGGQTNIPSVIRLYVTGEDLEAIINTRQKRNNNLR